MIFKKLFSGVILISFAGFNNICLGSTQELPEVVVTATRTEKSVSEAPASVNIVTKNEITIKCPQTIDEILNDLPGVMVKRGKGLMDTLSKITLRGIPDQKRTLLMIDGIILNDAYFGGVKLAGFFPEDLEKVEVVKGPFSSLYGGYAMGGVVNFITKMPEKREITFKAGYGTSFDRGEAMDDLRKLYLSYGNKIANKLSFFISYGRHDTNGYPTKFVTSKSAPAGTTGAIPSEYIKYGKVYNGFILGDKGDNRWWDDGITVKALYSFSKVTQAKITFLRTRYKYSYDKPHTYLYNATTGDKVYAPSEYDYIKYVGPGGRIQNILAFNYNTTFLNKLKMKLTLSYLNTEKDWYIFPLYGADIYGGPGKLSNTVQNRYNIDIQFTLPLFTNQVLTFGSSFIRDYANTKEKNLSNWKDESSTTSLRYQSKGKTCNYAFYIQDEIALKSNLTAYLGARADFWKAYDGYANQVGSSGYPKNYASHYKSAFSPKLAIVYKPFEGTVLRSSIGKAFRPPTVYELYRTWNYYSTTYAANPDLDPEKLIAYDIGIDQNLWKGAKISLTYFHNYLKDLIYRKSLNNVKIWVNVGKAETQGVEFQIEQKFNFGLKLFANLTYTDSEIKENESNPETEGKRLTYTPLWMGNIGAEIKKGSFSTYIVGRYMSKFFSDDLNRDKASYVPGSYDEYFVVDARVSYQLLKNASIILSLNNLFDEDFYQYYKAPGRSWFAEISIKF